MVEANLSTESTSNSTKYGWHYTGYEDHINNFSIVYTTRYTPLSGQQGKTEVVALKFDNNTGVQPEEFVIYEIEDCGNTKKGELQISPEGDKLIWYQHAKYIAGFAHRQVDIYSITLNPDKISSNGDVLIVNTAKSSIPADGMQFGHVAEMYLRI